jgi:hypothetical protein
MKKPEFKYINYDPDTICWGEGNNIVGARVIARFQFGELDDEEDLKLKREYEEAERIYNNFISVGRRFRGIGENTTKWMVLRITFIHAEKQYVKWKQCNTNDDFFDAKPASGKWSINALLNLVMRKEIEFIDN